METQKFVTGLQTLQFPCVCAVPILYSKKKGCSHLIGGKKGHLQNDKTADMVHNFAFPQQYQWNEVYLFCKLDFHSVPKKLMTSTNAAL